MHGAEQAVADAPLHDVVDGSFPPRSVACSGNQNRPPEKCQRNVSAKALPAPAPLDVTRRGLQHW